MENQFKDIGSPSNTNLQGPSWRDLLRKVADKDPWEGIRREDRDGWKDYLKQAQDIMLTPRQPLPKDFVCSIMKGDLKVTDPSISTSGQSKKVTIFLSSTFTDTNAERNVLMRDVYPYLRSVCKKMGLDFGTVDMRWGVKEHTSLSHETSKLCIKEIERCCRDSAGPAFLCMLGHKYGFRPFPAEIEQEEFEHIKKALENENENTSLLDEYFDLDTNVVPPSYVLKPRKKEQDDWWDIFEKIQVALQKGASKCLNNEKKEKYFISVTENEIKSGLINNLNKSQVFFVGRHLYGVEAEIHQHRHIIDMKDGKIANEAQACLRELKHVKAVDNLDKTKIIQFHYHKNEEDKCIEYVKDLCDEICEVLVKSILHKYETHLHMEEDVVFQEILQHRAILLEKVSLFVGRENLLDQIMAYCSRKNPNGNSIYAVHGTSGCGKTAVMAKAAQMVKSKYPEAVVVMRFLGTTSNSGTARSMLHSICTQICQAFDKEINTVPLSYNALIEFFFQLLNLASDSQPLFLYLDSLDQLSDENFGRNLKWLCLNAKLPQYAHVIVSTIPGKCFDVLHGFLAKDHLLEVKPLEVSDGPEILSKMLTAQNRALTDSQEKVVLDAFGKCPLPLFLRLAVDIGLTWHSYTEISADSIQADMRGLINMLFNLLELRFGKVFVHHALAYISASKNGLSVTELEDILSCDDIVLEEIFEFWIPPFRRIPQLLWIRIRNELGMYLVERGTDGVNAYGWYHRQFWEAAEERFLNTSPSRVTAPYRPQAHRALADYFEGKWSTGKIYNPKTDSIKDGKTAPKGTFGKIEDRQVPSQPIVISGNRNSKKILNVRKLSELSYQYIQLQDWDSFEKVIGSLEFIEAKFEAQMGYTCHSEFMEATELSGKKTLKKLSHFIGAGLSFLVNMPGAIYQLASQQTLSHPARIMQEGIPGQELPKPLIINMDTKNNTIEDPCEMTMTGHTGGVRCCRYSPDGTTIASSAEDNTLRLWDAFSGAEIVTVSGLSGPLCSSLADPYQGERPCCFSPDGKVIATGGGDGRLQIWDCSGALLFNVDGHTDCLADLSFSPDGKYLATCGKDHNIIIWDTSKYKEVKRIRIKGKGLACDFNKQGTSLAITGQVGLVLVNVSDWSVASEAQGYCHYQTCCCFHPNGYEVITAGTDNIITMWGGPGKATKLVKVIGYDSEVITAESWNSDITVWDVQTGKATKLVKGHSGYIWCLTFTKDGSIALSCSSDRVVKVWRTADWSLISSLGGHLLRVSWASILPTDEDKFVTCSLDRSLKVWDFPAIQRGETPPVAGLHYTALKSTPDMKYVAVSQGWSLQCTLRDVNTSSQTGTGPTQNGIIKQIIFTHDSQKMFVTDQGHDGNYVGNFYKNALITVSMVPSGKQEGTVPVTAPYSIACNTRYLAVGTAYSSEIHLFLISNYKDQLYTWGWGDEGTPIPQKCEAISVIAFHPGDKNHVVTGMGTLVKVWDICNIPNSVSLCCELQEHDDVLQCCIFSPNGEHFVTATFKGSVYIWDAQDPHYKCLHILSGHGGEIYDLDFSPSGDVLVTAGVEKSMCVWDVKESYHLKCTYYGSINVLSFVGEKDVAVGDATGHFHTLKLP